MLFIFIELFILSLSSSLDSLFACFGCGLNRIKIPLKSSLFMTITNTLFLSVSLTLGFFVGKFISIELSKWISFSVLMLTGIIKLFDELFKLFLSKIAQKTIKIRIFDFNLLINVLNDATKADIDKNKIISLKETLSLSFVLSLDNLGVGLGAGIKGEYYFLLIPLNFIFFLSSIYIGLFLGKKLSSKTKLDFSWASGLILIVLAIFKLIF